MLEVARRMKRNLIDGQMFTFVSTLILLLIERPLLSEPVFVFTDPKCDS